MFYCLVLLSLGALLAPAEGAPQLGGLGDLEDSVLELTYLINSINAGYVLTTDLATVKKLINKPKTYVEGVTKMAADILASLKLPNVDTAEAAAQLLELSNNLEPLTKLLAVITELFRGTNLPKHWLKPLSASVKALLEAFERLLPVVRDVIAAAEKVPDPSGTLSDAIGGLKLTLYTIQSQVTQLKFTLP